MQRPSPMEQELRSRSFCISLSMAILPGGYKNRVHLEFLGPHARTIAYAYTDESELHYFHNKQWDCT